MVALDFQIALFDMDGTLVDSMDYWRRVADDYLLSQNLIPPPTLWEEVRIMTMAQSATYLKKEYFPQKSEKQIIEECNRIIEENYRSRIPFKPAVLDYLKQLRSQSIPLFICTTTDLPLAELVMRRLGVLDWFEAIFTCTQVHASKSRSPAVYDAALEHLKQKGWIDREGNAPSRSIAAVFEDVGFASKTAFEAGYQVIGVYDETSKEDEPLIRKYSNHFIYSFEELL